MTDDPKEQTPAEEAPEAPRPPRRFRRWVRRLAMGVAALIAVAVIAPFSIDLGPALRHQAEVAGSRYINRPMRIGRLSVLLLRGQFVVEDLVIEGLTPGDRPFFRAKRIVASLDWSALAHREVLVDAVDMTDWDMLVETFPNGRHTFPRLTRQGPPPTGPRRFVTTVKLVTARRGQFTFEDHGTPWSTIARNLEVEVWKDTQYRGRAAFNGGTVRIQSYEPMWANMKTTFTIDGGQIHLDRIDLETDGARSVVTGDVDLTRWPEQTYQVKSQVHFPRMRELFFARDSFSLSGDGDFEGVFHLFKGGRDLKGRFTSPLAGVNAYRFSNLRGALHWTNTRFDVTDATCGFYGGRADFSYSMAPLSAPVRATARLDATYRDVDMATFGDFLELQGLRLAGRATGNNLLEWPLGRFAEHRGAGHVAIQPPPGARVLGRVVPEELAREEDLLGPEVGPLNRDPGLGYLPIGGELSYRFGPVWVDLEPSWMASPRTYVQFEGRTAYGSDSRIPFHVTSADWQESDRVLAGILTALGSPTRVVPVGGRGMFDGEMVGAFNRPRIEGRFKGERIRAWDVLWGAADGEVVIENGYVEVANGKVVEGDSELHASGLFSLGYPRRDGGEELDARIRLVRRPIVDLRHAFELDDYDLDGLMSGEFHLYDRYETPLGFGRMTIDRGVAYGERLDTATANLRFEGDGVRLDGIDVGKGNGRITGVAFVGWDGTYSFNADGRRIEMGSVQAMAYPGADLSGSMDFTATGAGTFDLPRYEVKGRIQDLFVRDEGIGQVSVRLGVRDEVLTLEIEAASPRLAVSGSGRVALTPEADTEMTFRFADTSLDPYVRIYDPRLSPFTTAVVSGSIHVAGELRNIDQLQVEGTVDQLDLRLFDYRVRNEGPVQIALDQHMVRIERARLGGEGTQLDLSGTVNLHDERIAVTAAGEANLGLLQGFFRDIRSAGSAQLIAEIYGPLRTPEFAGSATVVNGRIRHSSLPHSLEAINGRVSFDAGGVRIDDVKARLGGGDVQLGGRVGLTGYTPSEVSLTMVGQEMRVRYPEGFRSVIDADLVLRGDFFSPLLAGTVTVRDAVWSRRFEGDLLEFSGAQGIASAGSLETTIPLHFDIRILAPSTLRIQNNAARIVSSAELTLSGTYDRPLLFGRADIERGEVVFEGNRYLVTRGSIDFTNPARIEPFFDIEAETRVRVPGQTYQIIFHVVGTAEHFVPDLTSDPPLPTVDILSLLFGDPRDPRNAELRSLQSPEASEQELLRARAARLLASPISSGVGRVVERTLGVDTVVITPSLSDTSAQQSDRLEPTARMTLGKRITNRLYLTFSRSLTSSTRDQIILLEYDQTDRLAWIVSQNEDRTYALDFRVRHTF